MVALMIIFIALHVPWKLKSILFLKALLLKVVELLKEKVKMKILKPLIAPYSNRWFIVPKKSRPLTFIQDM